MKVYVDGIVMVHKESEQTIARDIKIQARTRAWERSTQ